VLAAAGHGPVLPAPLFEHAVAGLGGPTTRAGLAEELADRDLYRIIDRVRPGTPDEHVGLFHGTLAASLAADRRLTIVGGHIAILDAVAALAAPTSGSPGIDDPLQAYAYAAEALHLASVGRHDWIARSLAQREHSIPRENLVRHRAWLPHVIRMLGPDHPDTLTTRHNVASWTGHAGNSAEALRLFRELLPDRVRVLGPDHPLILMTQSNVAGWTGQAGNSAEALRLFRELLPDLVRVLGPGHPHTLVTRSNVAFWTGRAGNGAEALRLSRELLPDLVRVLGPDHPDTLTTRNNIAFLSDEIGQR
jgi:hypothetical protein